MIAAPVALVRDTDVVLDHAADYLQRYGWTPCGLYDSHDGCTLKCSCHYTGTYPASLIGALRFAVLGRPRWDLDTATDDTRHAYTAAVEWLNTYLIAIGHSCLHAPIFDWQAAPGLCAADAISALRAAAAAYRHSPQWRAAA